MPSAQVALNELQKAGHFVAIATGRAHYKARNFMESVGLHDMVCCGGGGLVIHDVLVQNIPLDLEKSKAIARQALSLGYGVLFALDDSIKVYTRIIHSKIKWVIVRNLRNIFMMKIWM